MTLGTLAVAVMMRVKKLPFAPLADAAAPGIILAQAIGRLGNWFNQELYGRPTSVPWGLEIYNRVDDAGKVAPMTGHSTGEVLAVVHPTFLYEMLWNLLICAVLLVGGSPLPHGSRAGVCPVCGGLHPWAVLD